MAAAIYLGLFGGGLAVAIAASIVLRKGVKKTAVQPTLPPPAV